MELQIFGTGSVTQTLVMVCLTKWWVRARAFARLQHPIDILKKVFRQLSPFPDFLTNLFRPLSSFVRATFPLVINPLT